MSEGQKIPIYRIALLGVSGVGKTQIVNQLVNNCFIPQHETTFLDMRSYKKLLNLGTEKNPLYCVLIIEDIFPITHPMIESGGERNAVRRKYTEILDNEAAKSAKKEKAEKKGSSRFSTNKQIYGYMFVFDASATGNDSIKALKQLETVIKFVQSAESRGINGDFTTKKFIIGNKKEGLSETDLTSIKQQPILRDTGIPVKFVSAKFNQDVTTVFQDLCKEIQEDPKILTVEEEWLKEQIEETKDEGKNGGGGGGLIAGLNMFKKPKIDLNFYEDENKEEVYEDRLMLEEDFQSYPMYQPQGMDTKSCEMF